MNPIDTALEEREFSEAPRPGGQTAEDFEMELRGYELAEKVGDSWRQVAHYRPTTRGWKHAISDGRWLQERWPKTQYAVRPIVSMKPPTPLVQERPSLVAAEETDGVR